MITSRRDGILVLKTSKPYKMAKGGQLSDATEIACKDVNYQAENVAFDIEQLFTSALIGMANKTSNISKDSAQPKETSIDTFDSDDSPSSADIQERANQLSLMFKMNSDNKMSELMKLFQGIVACGLIRAEGDVEITVNSPIWMSINRYDRLTIVFSYILFFVNPLSSLSDQSQIKTEKLAIDAANNG